MKGIILAGGLGTRLYPITKTISKQLLPIYDKPMIYYPLSVLMLAGISEVLVISTQRDIPMYQDLLGDGSRLGMRFEYCVQTKPRGLAEAFILGKEFIGNDSVCLILGDNVFFGTNFSARLKHAIELKSGALIYGYRVNNPRDYGVVEFDNARNVISIEEKPQNPMSNYAIPGLYFYDNQVISIAELLQPSARGELEITDINLEYMRRGMLKVELLGRGMAWLDTGTCLGLINAAIFVETIQARQGMYIACIEEIAYHNGFISRQQVLEVAQELSKTEYGAYLRNIAEDTI
jgi:glucose-1-phosphate thymidylyltransferase